MSKRTAYNENYKGLVESFSIPAEVHERNGKKYASFGGVVPIHICTPEEVAEKSKSTHHYCDIFTDMVLAPLGELAYVRLDENTAEKVFINRSKRILLISSDGELAQWRCAPSFESANLYMAGTPIVNKDGQLVSVVTAKKGNHYAVSNSEGEGGYFTTSESWRTIDSSEGGFIYGDRRFETREELRDYIAALRGAGVAGVEARGAVPVLHRAAPCRLALVAPAGLQLAHLYLHSVHAHDVQYL